MADETAAKALFRAEVLDRPESGLVVSVDLKGRLLALLASEDEEALLLRLAEWVKEKSVCPIS